MTSTDADLEAGQALVRDALVPYEQKPGASVIETLTEELIQVGRALRPDLAWRRPQSDAVLHDWDALVAAGPDDGPFGAWTHARALARAVRTMLKLLATDADR